MILLAKPGIWNASAIPSPPRGTDGAPGFPAPCLCWPLGLGPAGKAGRGHRAPDLTACFRVSGFTGPGFGPMERGSVVCTPRCGWPSLTCTGTCPAQPNPASQPAGRDQPGIFFLFAPVYPSLHHCDSGRPQMMRWMDRAPFFLLLTRTLTSQPGRTGQPATAPSQPCPPFWEMSHSRLFVATGLRHAIVYFRVMQHPAPTPRHL